MQALPPETRAEMAVDALYNTNAAFAEKLFAFLSEDDRPEAAPRVMWALNERRAGDAMAWALKQPEGPVRVAARSNLMTRYVFDDPVKVIDGFAAGKSRDAAYVAHVEKFARRGAAPDVSIVPKIADPEIRGEAARTIYRVWNRKEPGLRLNG